MIIKKSDVENIVNNFGYGVHIYRSGDLLLTCVTQYGEAVIMVRVLPNKYKIADEDKEIIRAATKEFYSDYLKKELVWL